MLLCFAPAFLTLVQQSTPAPASQPALPRPRLEVVAVSPAPNALHVPRADPLSVTFNRPLDPASVTDRSFRIDGRWSGVHSGSVSLTLGGRRLVFTPASAFSAGETVWVTLAQSLRSTAGDPLGRGYQWSFWADSISNRSGFTHIDTLVPGETPYGAYGGDLDGDGALDLCVPNENTSDVSVFMNGGSGNFGPAVSYGVGFHCSPSEGVDLDFDGDIDLAVANILDDDVSMLRGNGDGTFDPQERCPTGGQPRGLALLDADGDGDYDAVTANRSGDNMTLLLNDGLGTFVASGNFDAGVNGETGVAACDMNNDGFFDLVVAGYFSNRLAVLLGDGKGGFSLRSTHPIGSRPWMVVTGDLDGDGFNDVGAALSAAGTTAVALNDGTGALGAPSSYTADAFPIALDFGDINGDGHLDLASSSFSGGTFRLYHNDGNGAFVGAGVLPAITAGSCTVLHDFDGDGDVDITAVDEIADLIFVFRHDG